MERVKLPKRPASGAGTYPVGLLRPLRGSKAEPALGKQRPGEKFELNPRGCPRCWSSDIRPILTLQSVAWWGCPDCFHRWYAQRDDPAKLVNRGAFPGLPHRVIGSPKPPVEKGSRNGRRRLRQQVLKVKAFPLHKWW
ncbi:MAG: hypothetical protein ACE5KI_04405, partial [Dehalococcoidia bacterium]